VDQLSVVKTPFSGSIFGCQNHMPAKRGRVARGQHADGLPHAVLNEVRLFEDRIVAGQQVNKPVRGWRHELYLRRRDVMKPIGDART